MIFFEKGCDTLLWWRSEVIFVPHSFRIWQMVDTTPRFDLTDSFLLDVLRRRRRWAANYDLVVLVVLHLLCCWLHVRSMAVNVTLFLQSNLSTSISRHGSWANTTSEAPGCPTLLKIRWDEGREVNSILIMQPIKWISFAFICNIKGRKWRQDQSVDKVQVAGKEKYLFQIINHEPTETGNKYRKSKGGTRLSK